MGRSGHHSSRSYHHHHHYGSTRASLPLGFYIAVLVIVIIIMIALESNETNKIKGKEKLDTEISLSEYLYDEADYFADSKEQELIGGLEYFYETTGVQPVVYTTTDYVTEGYVTKLYYKMLTDESHIMIALPIDFFGNNDQYYYIGDDAETIITEVTMNEIFDRIDSSWSSKETAWNKSFREVAELIVSK